MNAAIAFGKRWLRFYFDPRGRATRADYNVRGMLFAVIGATVAGWLDTAVFTGDHNLFSIIFVYVVLASNISLSARRLHDMNLSGLWQAPIQLASIAAALYLQQAEMPTIDDPEDLMSVLDRLAEINSAIYLQVLAGLVVLLVFFLVLSAKRGTRGPNRYGADLLQTRQDW